MKKLNKYERRRKNILKLKFFIIITTICSMLSFIYFDFDRRMDLATDELIHTKSKAIITNTINNSINSLFTQKNIKSEDLYTPLFNENGDLLTIDVNTILINDICNTLSTDITNNLSVNTDYIISVPILTLYNLTILDGLGPVISNSILPTGSVEVTYDTSFKQAGINQTNFDLWLDITCTLQMASPITKSEVIQTRKVPIISTIINGDVPTYMQHTLTD